MVQEDKPSTDQRSPGAMLRTARESAGMSVEQVADKLHLLQSVVNSLEKDCYDRIRGETFVRGYLRNYARLLGIDADEVLSQVAVREPCTAAVTVDTASGPQVVPLLAPPRAAP